MSKNNNPLENYVSLLYLIENMKYSKKFEPKNFLRTIRPFCKTNHLKHKYLFIRIRGSSFGISIEVKQDSFIVQQNQRLHEFIFYCDTTKSLLSKLIKHNLLKP